MKFRLLWLWCLLPAAVGAVYPYINGNPVFLGWMTIGLLIYTLFFSVVVHELCHGLAAHWCGDSTAKQAGRLTLNPLSHVSLVGSILVPFALYVMHAPAVFGWAKPVPFNPIHLRRHPRDQVLIAVAGPLANFTLSYLCFCGYIGLGMVFNALFPDTRIMFHFDIFTPIVLQSVPFAAFWFVVFELLSFGMVLNVVLGVFNLIPFPPLDGSWILKAVLPKKISAYFGKIQILGFLLLLLALQFHLLEIFFYPALLILAVYQGIAAFCLG